MRRSCGPSCSVAVLNCERCAGADGAVRSRAWAGSLALDGWWLQPSHNLFDSLTQARLPSPSLPAPFHLVAPTVTCASPGPSETNGSGPALAVVPGLSRPCLARRGSCAACFNAAVATTWFSCTSEIYEE
ncbi:hypothetical protein U9M48_040920 [Paspalum notatum var. saurae]|uniref:Uncharacterized protein n=1 Tax=Paspalum notatum var. saurae TaxID=547442 RepID=A0AAQ3UM46_PASNO